VSVGGGEGKSDKKHKKVPNNKEFLFIFAKK
jgi:hypothetical protein